MTSVFYKDFSQYNNKGIIVNEMNYTFLDILQDYIDINSIYNMLDPYNMKLKNIYQFLYLRSIKINHAFDEIPKLDNINQSINSDELNEILVNTSLPSIVFVNRSMLLFSPHEMSQ